MNVAQKGGAASITTDHDVIRRWVEERGGCPATVKRTRRAGQPGVLRIDFPGYSGRETLEAIGWDEFFDKFEQNGLALLYQDRVAGGKTSRFAKLIRRETSTAKSSSGRRARPGGAETSRGRPRASATRQRTQATTRSRSSATKGRTQRTSGRSSAAGTSRTAGSSSTRASTSSRPTPRKRSTGSSGRKSSGR
jgi:hypothetical protein